MSRSSILNPLSSILDPRSSILDPRSSVTDLSLRISKRHPGRAYFHSAFAPIRFARERMLAMPWPVLLILTPSNPTPSSWTSITRSVEFSARTSTFSDPSFAAAQPLAAVEAKALAGARVPRPAFPNAARAQAMCLEEMQLAVLGRKTPKEAVAAIVERITPLMTA